MEDEEPIDENRHFVSTERSREGEPFVWLAAAGLLVGLVMALSLFSFVAWKGLGSFWPSRIDVWQLDDGSSVAGHFVRESKVGGQAEGQQPEIQIYQGNREINGARFRFIRRDEVNSIQRPKDMLFIERREQGPAIVKVESVALDGETIFPSGKNFPGVLQRINRSGSKWKESSDGELVGRTADGTRVECEVASISHVFAANRATSGDRVREMLRRIRRFFADSPRQANTQGGVFPAILGTVVMTLLMSVFVTPFGVIAAVYLREYAKQGFLVRFVRICVNNLAGVPSIVFGVFGLAFFVLFVGGGIDRMFYPDTYPSPTFKTPGILWASLTLAVLTLPVVIVSTEEALASVPKNVREAALACGASKWQMVQRVLLPASMPGILTGVILAMARGAGEVAPLMLVGVVKYAPSLPIDGESPFFHPERKFMHLGFHIYDLGFQSPDPEFVKPLVFATAFLLILVVVCLNLFAILLRARLRKRYVSNRF